MTETFARSERGRFKELAPDIDKLLSSFGVATAQSGLEKTLIDLIELRASQINGCAYCVQYHVLSAEAHHLHADKINLVAVWHEAPVFSARERAALAWTEAITLISEGISDELYEEVSKEFDEKELYYLTSAIIGINSWNRLGATFRWTPIQRKPARQSAAE